MADTYGTTPPEDPYDKVMYAIVGGGFLFIGALWFALGGLAS